MSDEPQAQRRYWSWWLLAIILAPVLYALSAGPVSYLTINNTRGREVARLVYKPLAWVHDYTPLKGSIERYVEWWNGLAE